MHKYLSVNLPLQHAMRLVPGALVALFAVMPGSAAAQINGSATIWTMNTYKDRSIWITIYDVGKTRHLDYGCVDVGDKRSWAAGNYLYGSFYYVRAEVKEGAKCAGGTLCDTTIRVNPQSPGPVAGDGAYEIHTGDKVWLVPNGNNCYWATTAPAGAFSPSSTASSAQPPHPAPSVQNTKQSAIANAAADAICQGFSDGYAIVAGHGFGFAPAQVRATWMQQKCNASPSAARKIPLCQELSNRFGMVAGGTFGHADGDAQGSWKAMGCTTSPKK
jgi:hypothetical protein